MILKPIKNPSWYSLSYHYHTFHYSYMVHYIIHFLHLLNFCLSQNFQSFPYFLLLHTLNPKFVKQQQQKFYYTTSCYESYHYAIVIKNLYFYNTDNKMYRGNSTFLLQNMCKQLSYYPLNINGNYVVF